MALLARLGVSTPFDGQHTFVTSPFISTFLLAVIRLLLGSYSLLLIVYVLVHESVVDHSDLFFSYFTHLSNIGLCAYLFAAGFQTYVYWRSKRRGYPLQRWPRALQFLHVLLHTTIITFPILVTIVYWALLANGDTFKTTYSAWANTSQHILNTVFAIFEIFFTHIGPAPWLHLPIVVLILAGYLGIAYITRASQGQYVYAFLDPKKQGAKLAAYIIGIALAEVIIFVFVRSLVLLRERLFSSYVRRASSSAEEEKLEQWEDIERPSVNI